MQQCQWTTRWYKDPEPVSRYLGKVTGLCKDSYVAKKWRWVVVWSMWRREEDFLLREGMVGM